MSNFLLIFSLTCSFLFILFGIVLLLSHYFNKLWGEYEEEVIRALSKYKLRVYRERMMTMVKKKKISPERIVTPFTVNKNTHFLHPLNTNFKIIVFNDVFAFSTNLFFHRGKTIFNNVYLFNNRDAFKKFKPVWILNNRRLKSYYALSNHLFLTGMFRRLDFEESYLLVDSKAYLIRAERLDAKKINKLILITKFNIFLDFIYWCLIEKNIILQKFFFKK